MYTSTFDDQPLISLAEAAEKIPGSRGADRVHPATLTRWITKGFRLPSGEVVRLAAKKCASRWLTTQATLDQFFASLTLAAIPETDTAMMREPSVRYPEARRAGRELDRIDMGRRRKK
jgi:hypothetical protein